MAKEQNKKTTVGLSDEEIIEDCETVTRRLPVTISTASAASLTTSIISTMG